MTDQERFMKEAIRQARKALALKEVPIGCVIVCDGKIIARGYNRRNTDKNTLSHAELNAIRKASNVMLISLLMAISATIVICYFQPFTLEDVLFEVFSAIGTVGMSTGITRDLSKASRVVIILLMYCGRIGSMSFALSFLERKKVAPVQCPVEKVMIG